jgi:hypothetical protein
VVLSCYDFYFHNKKEFEKFEEFFQSCELGEYLVLDKFKCQNGKIGVTVDSKTSYANMADETFEGLATEDEIAALTLFEEELKQKHPEIVYG